MENVIDGVIESLNIVRLEDLEEGLTRCWLEAGKLAFELQGKFAQVGQYLWMMKGDEENAPFKQSGYSTWQEYVEHVLEPKLGISYVRSLQIAGAWESKQEIFDTLEQVERRAIAQQIAQSLGATLREAPTNEGALRACAGLSPEEKTAVVGIASAITNGAEPTFTSVMKAKKLVGAVKRGAIQFNGESAPTTAQVESALLLEKIVKELKGLDTLHLHQLEDAIADEIVKRSTHGDYRE